MLVEKDAFDHINFFPQSVPVQMELRTCVVSHDGSGAGDLTALALQKSTVNQR